ncbi:hypothetical protein [Agaribacter flavus]|uniref:Uncharacterized protein n=1 Tax=Agaribacter flavus TaxID=1902781 RepID=A0ABV7FSR3_9ALTE
MNKLINIVLSGLLWRRYKFLIVSLVLLIVSLVVVGQVHKDYVEFAQATDNTSSLGMSFVVKWGVWLLLISIFLAANHFYNKQKDKAEAQKSNTNSALSKVLKWRNDKLYAASKSSSPPSKSKQKTTEIDPFEQIRTREKLRSYADLLIESKETKDNSNDGHQ